MSFISTYSSLSSRGWSSGQGVGSILIQDQTITPTTLANNSLYGKSISLTSDGNYFATSANPGSGLGASYVYNKSANSFSLQSRISVVYGPSLNQYGNVLIGSSSNTSGNITYGTLPIYTRSGSTWTLSQTLTNSPPINNDNFGYINCISGDGNIIIVCATSGPTALGSMFTFVNSSGTYIQTQVQYPLGPSNIATVDKSIAMSEDGNYFIVGHNYDGTSGPLCYADVYVRTGNTFAYQTRLTSSDGVVGDLFGQSVSLNYDGSIALIGAPRVSQSGNANVGAAYTFVRTGSTWSQQQKILNSNPSANDFFGTSLSISSDSTAAVISSIYEDTGGTNRGSSYIYFNVGNMYYVSQQLNGSANNDFFGQGVAISNQINWTTIVGAQEADSSPYVNLGKVYIYSS